MQSSFLALSVAAVTFTLTACSRGAPDKAADSDQIAAVVPSKKPLGEKLYLQCRACHTLTASGANGVGPNLHNVVGAKAAAKPGYLYSPALTQSGIVWTPEKLDAFLTKPNAVVPGTKMVFAGVTSAKARTDLIAYLKQNQGE